MMIYEKGLKQAIENRRSFYALTNQSPISDDEIKEIIDFAVLNVPSSFNSQSTRVVLLLEKSHSKLWDIVKSTLKKKISAEAFAASEAKINGAFAAGYGTILFYEDESVIEGLQNTFPTYKDNFPIWSQHTSAMHQFTIWSLLEEAGLSASLQHYNPIIDADVAKTFNINQKWKLIAQMPFGKPIKKLDKRHTSLLKTGYSYLDKSRTNYIFLNKKKPANSLRRLSNLNTNFTKLHNNRVKLQPI